MDLPEAVVRRYTGFTPISNRALTRCGSNLLVSSFKDKTISPPSEPRRFVKGLSSIRGLVEPSARVIKESGVRQRPRSLCPLFSYRILRFSQIITVPSAEPVASCLLSGEKARVVTKSLCPRVRSFLPVSVFQIITVPSSEPVASCLLSGEKARVVTQLLCPVRVRSFLPVSVFQIITVPSSEPVASCLLSGEKARVVTKSLCPRVRSFLPVSVFQIITVLSSEPLASCLLSGEKARVVTRPLCPVRVRSFLP